MTVSKFPPPQHLNNRQRVLYTDATEATIYRAEIGGIDARRNEYERYLEYINSLGRHLTEVK